MNRKILCMTYRDHRRTPVVNGEACQGDCYAYDDVLKLKGEVWTVESLTGVLGDLLRMHAGICGNANYRLGIDLDEVRGLYIGSFLHFGALETCVGGSLQEVIEGLRDITARYFASDAYLSDLQADPGKGRDACAYGEDRALVGWMVSASGVDLTLLGGDIETATALLTKRVSETTGLLTQPGLLAT